DNKPLASTPGDNKPPVNTPDSEPAAPATSVTSEQPYEASMTGTFKAHKPSATPTGKVTVSLSPYEGAAAINKNWT
ncbi:hypothetical protein C6P44_002504, partial [Monosporozyma unispora]